ncbi:hybrid sensor histidine kinase/response regulator [Leptolyngbya sp. 'hensonii']|uniref:hybrid sensor histidine kinase/response regulator n=1 Tax=Leptolyngbya sp. 'hensonii' TaxID=1922337 RepID=UPI00094F7473|nr:hybrid sensor histidine kinase/response regulator [Leptolyngbya sp. 'hensonii']OLP15497.1 hybrid sensor histidine kinase/response regulator [Leptolyngbya sp. 'hensonii']
MDLSNSLCPPQIESSKGNILIVDDTPSNLRLLSTILVQHGYEVRSAINGAAALMAIEATLPDLILLDINMPRMNGYDVCAQLKAQEDTKDIPIIFLSALDETTDKVRAFQVGGVDYITKPFQVEEVLVRVETQLSQQRLKQELEAARTEALKALAQEKELNRLKSEFVSMITHDFRSPLTSIQGFAELLHRAGQNLSPDTIDRYFKKIDTAVEHLLHLLDEVLLIGGIETGKIQVKPVPIDLEVFCRELTDMMQPEAGSTHQIDFRCNHTCNSVSVDPTLLQQILTNLLSNAIKYSPDGGVIQFELDCQTEVVMFQIKDNGIGIPPENQPQLFETFYRGSNVGQIRGTGLGLAVVKRCVEAHGGELQLQSGIGTGTTIRFTLPVQPTHPNPDSAAPTLLSHRGESERSPSEWDK